MNKRVNQGLRPPQQIVLIYLVPPVGYYFYPPLNSPAGHKDLIVRSFPLIDRYPDLPHPCLIELVSGHVVHPE